MWRDKESECVSEPAHFCVLLCVLLCEWNMNGLENAFFHVRYPKKKNKEASTTSRKKHIHTHTRSHTCSQRKTFCEKENDNDNCVRVCEGGWVHAMNYKMFSVQVKSSSWLLLLSSFYWEKDGRTVCCIVFQQLKLFHAIKSHKTISKCTHTHMLAHSDGISAAPCRTTTTFHISFSKHHCHRNCDR